MTSPPRSARCSRASSTSSPRGAPRSSSSSTVRPKCARRRSTRVVAELVLPRLTEPEPLLVGAGVHRRRRDRARARRALRLVARPARREPRARLDHRADAPRPHDPRVHRVPARLPRTRVVPHPRDDPARARHRALRRPPLHVRLHPHDDDAGARGIDSEAAPHGRRHRRRRLGAPARARAPRRVPRRARHRSPS